MEQVIENLMHQMKAMKAKAKIAKEAGKRDVYLAFRQGEQRLLRQIVQFETSHGVHHYKPKPPKKQRDAEEGEEGATAAEGEE